jgi:hypothetical protein
MPDDEQISVPVQVFCFICVPLENIFPWILVIISCILTVKSINEHNHQLQSGSIQDSLKNRAYRALRRKTRFVFRRVPQDSQLPPQDRSPAQPCPNEDNKRTATINILILTIVYLLFNTFSVTIFSMDVIEMFFEDDFVLYERISPRAEAIILLLAWVYSVAMNSACNVLVYFCRLNSLRTFTVSTVTACRMPENQEVTQLKTYSTTDSRQRTSASLTIHGLARLKTLSTACSPRLSTLSTTSRHRTSILSTTSRTRTSTSLTIS